MSFTACLTYFVSVAFDGRSLTDVKRPKLPIASFQRASADSMIKSCFQNPNAQCALKAAMLHSIPL